MRYFFAAPACARPCAVVAGCRYRQGFFPCLTLPRWREFSGGLFFSSGIIPEAAVSDDNVRSLKKGGLAFSLRATQEREGRFRLREAGHESVVGGVVAGMMTES